MFWLVLTVAGLAATLVKLGTYIVWLGVAKTLLKVGLLALLVLALVVIGHMTRKSKP